MPRKKAEAVAATPTLETPATPEVKATAKYDALSVYAADGHFVRTYTKEQHGERVQEFAEQFAKKIGGSVKKA